MQHGLKCTVVSGLACILLGLLSKADISAFRFFKYTQLIFTVDLIASVQTYPLYKFVFFVFDFCLSTFHPLDLPVFSLHTLQGCYVKCYL